jgi:hypothetical protein
MKATSAEDFGKAVASAGYATASADKYATKVGDFAKSVASQVSADEGGVFSGPNSGYPATLHGDEAVIPLNNNGGNFVKMFEDIAASNREIVGMMEEMVRAQNNSVDVQTKLLRAQA